jgi:MFS superfamily sulfate permease-like transporter
MTSDSNQNFTEKSNNSGIQPTLTGDLLAGFVVFLLAMPLSLGIAKASDFPPMMGLLTAITGGLFVSFFSGSQLSIKGPAAGLIVIVAGAVNDFGGGEAGWKLALGTIFVAGFLQLIFGFLRLGRLVDFFPLSTVHGMLAAIGIIIIIKQFPVLLNLDASIFKGKSVPHLLISIPANLRDLDPRATLVGVISLWIMLAWNTHSLSALRKVPAPLVVLLFAIPAGILLDLKTKSEGTPLLEIGSLMDGLGWHADFSGINRPLIFIRYTLMFALVGSIESLLTVKATDLMDPLKRKSRNSKDLIAVGLGNMLASGLGGLPMISEVSRSSANVNNGGLTVRANFFHGLFLLLFVLMAIPLINLIPNTALAAMLISVGLKLAHPKEFVHIFKIGKDQLAIFIVTILITLFQDLLWGIGAGILLKIIFHLLNGAPLKSLFSVVAGVSFNGSNYLIEVEEVAAFTNFLGIKSRLKAVPAGMNLTIDFSKTIFVDHSVLDNIEIFKKEYVEKGGTVQVIGLDQHKPTSDHPLASRIKSTKHGGGIDEKG